MGSSQEVNLISLSRTIRISTKSASVDTPALFPVHNAGFRGRGNTPHYWEQIPDLPHMMLNAAFRARTSHFEDFRRLGVRAYFGVPGAVFLDSGGLQTRTRGLALDALKILRIQEELGADIGTALDMPVLGTDREWGPRYRRFLRTNAANVLRCLGKRNTGMLLFGVAHGNSPTAVRNFITYVRRKGDPDGFALGGLVFKRSNVKAFVDLILAARQAAGDLPLHVLGVAGPNYVPLLVFLGVDTFDSSSSVICGGYRHYFAPDRGSVEFSSFEGLSYLPCVCPVCSVRTASEVHAKRDLVSMHNLWHLASELRRLRWEIATGDVPSYLESRFSRNPLLKRAFLYARQKMRGL